MLKLKKLTFGKGLGRLEKVVSGLMAGMGIIIYLGKVSLG